MSRQQRENFIIRGTCMEMCPSEERLKREREGLLHKFEKLAVPDEPESWPVEESGNIGVSRMNNPRQNIRLGGRNRLSQKPKADVKKTIKSFSRSAAGQDKTRPEDLRPVSVLKDTVKYLFSEILTRSDVSFVVIYDFIFDRLRAVRQDLVIQRIENKDAILLLESIVGFHVYADFRLRAEPISVYDPKINHKHLVDCLRKLLTLYEYNNYWESSRIQFEALQCLAFPSSYDVIARNSQLVAKAIDIALAFQSHNYVRFFRGMGQLPAFLQMYCVRYVSGIRSNAYQIMCSAYGVGTCKIPLELIASVLGYKSVADAHNDIAKLGIEIVRSENDSKEKFVKFVKSQRTIIKNKTEASEIISSEFSSTDLDLIYRDKTNQLAVKMISFRLLTS